MLSKLYYIQDQFAFDCHKILSSWLFSLSIYVPAQCKMTALHFIILFIYGFDYNKEALNQEMMGKGGGAKD